MSTECVQEALSTIRHHVAKADFVGPRSEELVRDAERMLSVRFPPSYRLFLRELGAGNFGSEEVFGVIANDPVDSAIPDAIWMTMEARRDWRLPPTYVVVYFDGASDYYIIDTSEAIEPCVRSLTPNVSQFDEPLPVIASDFGSFLLRIVEEELDEET